MKNGPFAAIFSPLPSGYTDLHPLVDRYDGVSVQRPYPEDCAFKPTIARNGVVDTVVLIHVLADAERVADDANRIPIRMRASRFSRYLSNHFDYDDSDAASPPEENVRESRQSKQPIDLLIADEFFVDSKAQAICDKDGRAVSPKDILDFAYDAHVRTLQTLHPLRVQQRWVKATGATLKPVLDSTSAFLRFLLKWPLGSELVGDRELRFLSQGYRREDVRKLTADSIKLFAYLVPKHVAITFCLIVAVSFWIYHAVGLSCAYVRAVMSNTALTLTHAILILVLLDVVLPELIRRTLNLVIVRRSRLG